MGSSMSCVTFCGAGQSPSARVQALCLNLKIDIDILKNPGGEPQRGERVFLNITFLGLGFAHEIGSVGDLTDLVS